MGAQDSRLKGFVGTRQIGKAILKAFSTMCDFLVEQKSRLPLTIIHLQKSLPLADTAWLKGINPSEGGDALRNLVERVNCLCGEDSPAILAVKLNAICTVCE